MIDLKKANATDPLKRMVEKESGAEEYYGTARCLHAANGGCHSI